MSNFLKEKAQSLAYKLLDPIVNMVASIGITPNMVTVTGLLLNVVATAYLIFQNPATTGHTALGIWGILVLLAGSLDMLDGRLARVYNQSSAFGALFDSVIDRYSELVMFLGICYYLIIHHYPVSALIAFLAMIGSVMVSYVRARAEGLGIECKGGLMQRPERILLLTGAAILCGTYSVFFRSFQLYEGRSLLAIADELIIFMVPVFVLAVLANWTAMVRLQESKKALTHKK